jgi:hypothetical protein
MFWLYRAISRPYPKNISISLSSTFGIPSVYIDGAVFVYAIQQLDYTNPTTNEECIDP